MACSQVLQQLRAFCFEQRVLRESGEHIRVWMRPRHLHLQASRNEFSEPVHLWISSLLHQLLLLSLRTPEPPNLAPGWREYSGLYRVHRRSMFLLLASGPCPAAADFSGPACEFPWLVFRLCG